MKSNSKEKILVTGCAGFIGMHTVLSLLNDDIIVLGIDNLNAYYDVELKKNRLKILMDFKTFSFSNTDITNMSDMKKIFSQFQPSKVVNLAAQAGVRYSLENPHTYIDTNIVGFMNLLECCKEYNIESLIYASSSSVYGGNKEIPFSEKQKIDNPIYLLWSNDFQNLHESFSDKKFIFVENEQNKTIMDFYLLTLCQNFIVGPTSFHWWGAWLSQNNNKICVRPKNINQSSNLDFWPDSWISL